MARGKRHDEASHTEAAHGEVAHVAARPTNEEREPAEWAVYHVDGDSHHERSRPTATTIATGGHGESAPAPAVYQHFGLTAANAVVTVKQLLGIG